MTVSEQYWKCIPTWGFGMSAASYLNGSRFARPRSMQQYSNWVESNLTPLARTDKASHTDMEEGGTLDRLLDVIMLSLRTSDGLDLSAVERSFGVEVSTRIRLAAATFEEQQLVLTARSYEGAECIRLVDPEGFLLSNDIISSIFAAVA